MTILELHRDNARKADDRPDSPCAALAALLAEARSDRALLLALLVEIAAKFDHGMIIGRDSATHRNIDAVIAIMERRIRSQ